MYHVVPYMYYRTPTCTPGKSGLHWPQKGRSTVTAILQLNVPSKHAALAGGAQWVGASTHTPKGGRCDPGLGRVQEATYQCFSLPPPLSNKQIIIKKWLSGTGTYVRKIRVKHHLSYVNNLLNQREVGGDAWLADTLATSDHSQRMENT